MVGVLQVADGWSSPIRPVLSGVAGAVAAAHPLAVAAGQIMLAAGGTAVDAAIAAQAVLCVVAPDACGLGGDMLALVADRERTYAVNGAGAAPRGLTDAAADGGASVTVPGLVDGWAVLHDRWGRLPLAQVLAPAIRHAEQGVPIAVDLADAVARQRHRLLRGGAGGWPLMRLGAGERFAQSALAAILREIGAGGAGAFYSGPAAAAIVQAVRADGGALNADDLRAHRTETPAPIEIRFGEAIVAVQPPMTQGVLLAASLAALDRLPPDPAIEDHLGVELTEAAFAHRDDVSRGAALLAEVLAADPKRAARRGGPRAYLHTAGVATADAAGLVVSSLVSVFDDFGSCVFVPELGITLNNRAGGFTTGANAAAPGERPVHTLAPAMLRWPGGTLALATPGADGQVQTLLQVIGRMVRRDEDLASAIAAPRWRSEAGAVLIEAGHPGAPALTALGHEIREVAAGDMRLGAVVGAGIMAGAPIAVADWRRRCWAGVA